MVKDMQSGNRILKHMKLYQVLSSSRVNVEKSEAWWIGRSKGKNEKPSNVNKYGFTTEAIKALGFNFSYDKQIAYSKSFFRLIIDSRVLLVIWNQQWLSSYGKVQVLKSLIVSKSVCVAMMNKPLEDLTDALQSMQTQFIDLFSMSSCIATRQLVHNGGYVQKPL